MHASAAELDKNTLKIMEFVMKFKSTNANKTNDEMCLKLRSTSLKNILYRCKIDQDLKIDLIMFRY